MLTYFRSGQPFAKLDAQFGCRHKILYLFTLVSITLAL